MSIELPWTGWLWAFLNGPVLSDEHTIATSSNSMWKYVNINHDILNLSNHDVDQSWVYQILSPPLFEANCNLDGKNRLGGARVRRSLWALEPCLFLAQLNRLHHGFDSAELQLVPPDLRLRGCTESIYTKCRHVIIFYLRQGWSSPMQSASLSSLRAFWEFLRQGYTYCNSYP